MNRFLDSSRIGWLGGVPAVLACKRPAGLAVIAVLTIVVSLAGCGSSGSASVSAGAYVKSLCTAIAPFEQDFQARSASFKAQLPAARTAAQGKSEFQGFFSAVAADAAAVVKGLKEAGTPKVANGMVVATGIANAFSQLHDSLSTGASQASSLPTSSPAAFRTAAQSLVRGISSSANAINSSLASLKSPALVKTQASEPACKLLTPSQGPRAN